jgi:hypothetical protein
MSTADFSDRVPSRGFASNYSLHTRLLTLHVRVHALLFLAGWVFELAQTQRGCLAKQTAAVPGAAQLPSAAAAAAAISATAVSIPTGVLPC